MKTKKVQVSKEYELRYTGETSPGSVLVEYTGNFGFRLSIEAINHEGRPTENADRFAREVIPAALDFWRECQPLGDDEFEHAGDRVRFRSARTWMNEPSVVDSTSREWFPFCKFGTGCPDPEKARRWWLANYPMPPGKGLDLATGKVRDLAPGETWDAVGKRIVEKPVSARKFAECYIEQASTEIDPAYPPPRSRRWHATVRGFGCYPTPEPHMARLVTAKNGVTVEDGRIHVIQIGDFTPAAALELAESLTRAAREAMGQ